MRKITIYPPHWIPKQPRSKWTAEYESNGTQDIQEVSIHTIWSHRNVLITGFDRHDGLGIRYFISIPDDQIAIHGVCSLRESNWITEHLINAGLTPADATTVAQVLWDAGDF